MFTTNYLKARSINIDDVNKVLGVEIIDNKVVQKEISYKDISFKNYLGFKYQYGKEKYSPESYLKREYEKAGKEIESNYYFYEERLIQEKQIEKDIIFEKGGFWLASPAVIGYGSSASFGLGVVGNGGVDLSNYLFDSDGYWYASDLSVRPVGVLKSDIPLKDLPLFLK